MMHTTTTKFQSFQCVHSFKKQKERFIYLFIFFYYRFGRHCHKMAPTRSQILTVPQQFLLPSGSQVISCNYCFCDNYFFILLPLPTFFNLIFYWNSHGTALVLFEVVLIKYSTPAKEASTKVIVAKTVVIIWLPG